MATAQAGKEAQLAQTKAELLVANAQAEKERALYQLQADVEANKARKDLAYELAKTRMNQKLIEEELGVSLIQREKQIEVEELEVRRRERELEHMIKKPAEAEQFRIKTMAEAENERQCTVAKAEAEAERTRGRAEAEIIEVKGKAEAESIRQRGLAEAEGLRARLLAEADGMEQKARAWEQYSPVALADRMIERLPELASAVAAPLEKIDRIVLVNNGTAGEGSGTGVERITGGITQILTQLPAMVQTMTGVNLEEMIAQVSGVLPGREQARVERPTAPLLSEQESEATPDEPGQAPPPRSASGAGAIAAPVVLSD